jgi:hypothetical protein
MKYEKLSYKDTDARFTCNYSLTRQKKGYFYFQKTHKSLKSRAETWWMIMSRFTIQPRILRLLIFEKNIKGLQKVTFQSQPQCGWCELPSHPRYGCGEESERAEVGHMKPELVRVQTAQTPPAKHQLISSPYTYSNTQLHTSYRICLLHGYCLTF